MKQSVLLYGAPGRGYDHSGQVPPQQYPPGYYAPAYYPPPYYYYGQPAVNPYEAARQGESADRLASMIWKLVLVVVVCVVVGFAGFVLLIT